MRIQRGSKVYAIISETIAARVKATGLTYAQVDAHYASRGLSQTRKLFDLLTGESIGRIYNADDSVTDEHILTALKDAYAALSAGSEVQA